MDLKKALLYLFLLAAVGFFFYNSLGRMQEESPTVPLNRVADLIKKGQVSKITVRGDGLRIKRTNGKVLLSRKEPEVGVVETLGGLGVRQEELEGIEIEVASPNSWADWLSILGTFLPLLFVGLFFYFLMRQAQGANSRALSFGRSRPRIFKGDQPQVTFDDVGGLKEAKEDLQEVVGFLKEPERFISLGARVPKGIILIGAPGTGKCIAGGSSVLTDKGLIEIGEIPKYFYVDGDNRVWGARVSTIKPNPLEPVRQMASQWYNLGQSETLIITTKLGHSIEGTYEHPIVVLDEKGDLVFRRLEELKIGDYVAIHYNDQLFGESNTISEETAYLLGLLVGDGGTTVRNRLSFINSEPQMVESFSQYFRNRYGYEVKKGTRPYDYYVSKRAIKQDLLRWGLLETHAEGKRVPEWVLMSKKPVVVSFLRGLFDADGTFDERGYLIYSSASETLVKQMSMLLLNLGVVNRLHSRRKRYNGKMQFYLDIPGDFLEAFRREVGFGLRRKREALEAYISEKERNTNVNVIPYQGRRLGEIWDFLIAKGSKPYLKTDTNLYKDIRRYIRGDRRPSLTTLRRSLRVFAQIEPKVKELPAYRHLERLAWGYLFFSPIVSIERSRNVVYDFTVPGEHSFVANGFINHNTLLAKAVSGEAGVPFFSISGSEFVEMFVGVGASITGDTPVLIKADSRTRLMPISEFVDEYYDGDEEGFPVPVSGIKTLGFEELDSKFKGSPKVFFGKSAWKDVSAVFRHRVSEIYEIHYLGGMIETTGDHSIFVRTRDGLKAKAAKELKPGDVLVNLPFKPEEEYWKLVIGKTVNPFAEEEMADMSKKPYVRKVVAKPYDGYVYDLCGCENEAFFGGEKPVLLHNSRVRDLFSKAKRNIPCIVFIDELDAVGRHRGAGLGGSHDEREQTLNQILVEMDGFDTDTRVIVMAATNRPDILDPALLRPGRFDRKVVLDRPDIEAREAIFKIHVRGKPIEDDVDLGVLARQTPGLVGSDIENIVNEAAILAAKRGKSAIGMEEFERATERVIAGRERKSRVISDEEKEIIAHHEAGHALVMHELPHCDPVHKISIVSRGMSLGYTLPLPEEDKYLGRKSKFEDELAGLLGGRVAEEMVFGDLTTGATNDLEQATRLARKMVTRYGMSEKLGPLTFGKKEELVFLGKEIGEQRDYSEEVAREIDREVMRIINEAYERAKDILTTKRDKLEALARRLIEKETLEGKELEALLAG